MPFHLFASILRVIAQHACGGDVYGFGSGRRHDQQASNETHQAPRQTEPMLSRRQSSAAGNG
jgi:hypothetical protein